MSDLPQYIDAAASDLAADCSQPTHVESFLLGANFVLSVFQEGRKIVSNSYEEGLFMANPVMTKMVLATTPLDAAVFGALSFLEASEPLARLAVSKVAERACFDAATPNE